MNIVFCASWIAVGFATFPVEETDPESIAKAWRFLTSCPWGQPGFPHTGVEVMSERGYKTIRRGYWYWDGDHEFAEFLKFVDELCGGKKEGKRVLKYTSGDAYAMHTALLKLHTWSESTRVKEASEIASLKMEKAIRTMACNPDTETLDIEVDELEYKAVAMAYDNFIDI